jgi:hypothetical protein
MCRPFEEEDLLHRIQFRRPSPATAISMIALFVALGGTSYAAVNALAPKNSVGSGQVINGSLKTLDLSKKARAALKGNRGVPGAQGAQGPQGAAGAAGAAGGAGAIGAAGAAGATGPAGAAGAAGATGPAGPAGATGPAGAPNPNADTLNGFAANRLVRATTASAGTPGDPCGGPAVIASFSSTTFTSLIARTITAPANGILLIWGRTSVELNSGSPAGSSLRLLGRLTVDDAQAGGQSETSLTDTAQTCKEGRTMAEATAVQVTAGDHTVALQAAKSAITGGTGIAYIGSAALTTLFVPFGNAGTQGTLAPSDFPSSATSSNR